MDCRERIIKDVCCMLSSNLKSDDLQLVQNAIALSLVNYEVLERCTDLVAPDNTTDNILKMYAGSLLTEGKSVKTVKAYIRLLKSFSANIESPILEVQPIEITAYLAKLHNSVQKQTIKVYRSYLSAFYKWLKLEELIKKNPLEKIKPIKTSDKLRQPFTDVEIDKLRGACRNKRDRALLEVMLSSGVRLQELVSLNKADVNFNDLSIFVRKGKGGKQRKSYISTVCAVHLQDYLSTRKDDEESLFVSNYRVRISPTSVERSMHKLEEKACVMNVHPHKFRRTFATNLLRKGTDLRTIQILMGHENINTTMRYITLSQDYIKNEYCQGCAV